MGAYLQLVTPGNLKQMHLPHTVIPGGGVNEVLFGNSIFTYGLGWMIAPYKGHTLVHHGGNVEGHSLMVACVPQERVGVVVMVNVAASLLRDALLYEALDRALGLPADDWSAFNLPGDAIGVRMLRNSYQDEDGVPQLHPAFNSDLYGDETDLVINIIEDDVALIAVIGGESESVRTWAEQLNGLDVPKIALVTAALEPLAIPYVEAEAYAGYLAGYRDAASYNASRNANTREPYTVPDGIEFDVPNPETARWHSGALGAAIAAGLIALGMVINLFRGLVRRGRR